MHIKEKGLDIYTPIINLMNILYTNEGNAAWAIVAVTFSQMHYSIIVAKVLSILLIYQ